jgi:NAD(P)-dependent dehydrogenase (short-subunit alcohol dehydrogenase family)
MFNLNDKVIVVTGGTGILGAAFVKGIAEAAGKVVILGRNAAEGEDRVRQLREAGGEALFIAADVLSETDLQEALSRTLQAYGRVDGLVNGAGGNIPEAVIGPGEDVFAMNLPALRKAFDLNLFGTLLPTTVFGRAIADGPGGAASSTSPQWRRSRPLPGCWATRWQRQPSTILPAGWPWNSPTDTATRYA